VAIATKEGGYFFQKERNINMAIDDLLHSDMAIDDLLHSDMVCVSVFYTGK
jgi:hypothetical protein